ncbi:hypothetical protein EDB87DRAFT_1581054 [Lactarius vividus]|nr:hypothetical protein EDB87DRAFT_1581054 [Lactarius vividus]
MVTSFPPLVMATLPTATYCSVDAAPSDATRSCADKQPETVLREFRMGFRPRTKSTVLLPLDVVIPEERLPNILEVYDKGASALLGVIFPYAHGLYDKGTLLSIAPSNPASLSPAEYRSLERFLACSPVKYERKYPKRTPTTLEGEEIVDDVSKASANVDSRTIGQLDLSRQRRLGTGSHSYVFLASFTLPSCAQPSLRGEVAVKIATVHQGPEDCKMLENEAKNYAKFPCGLQESTPSSSPVVAKFFGYYTPSCESVDSYKGEDGDEEGARTVRRDVRKLLDSIISPILLLEPCGEPIKDNLELSTSDRDTILGMFDRLHNAGFTQNSTYRRNVLVQPGPLTRPLAERSLDNPSYRIIDFGRGRDCNGDVSHFTDKEMRREQTKVSILSFQGFGMASLKTIKYRFRTEFLVIHVLPRPGRRPLDLFNTVLSSTTSSQDG